MIDTAALREKVLDLAIRGKLVPQDPNDEPASVLLERIHEQKLQMVREGKLKAKDVKDDTIIFKGDDNCYYEKFSDGSVKNIQDEIPFDLPVGWAWSRLGFLAQYKKGPFGSSITKSMFVPDSNQAIKVYEQKNAIEKNAEIGRYFISQEKYKELRAFEIFPNDIIVSCAGTIGETFVMPHNMRKGIINQALMKISLYNLQIIDFYLIYFDFRLKSLANEQGYGVALKNIPPFDILKKYLVPIPPINEQYRIIKENENILNLIQQIGNNRNELNKIKTLLKSKILELAIQGQLVPQDKNDEPASVLLERIRAERKAKLGKKYVESYIFKGDDNCYYEKVGSLTKNITAEIPFDIPNSWSWIRLSNITTLITKGTTPRGDAYTYTNSGIGFLRAENIVGFDKISKKDLKYINETTHYNFLKRSILEENDILITIAGTLGRTGMVTKEDLPLNANQAVSIVRVVNGYKIDLLYLIFVLNAPIIKKYLLSKSVEMAIPNLSLENISDCVIPLPPIQEQYNITKKISQLLDILKGGD